MELLGVSVLPILAVEMVSAGKRGSCIVEDAARLCIPLVPWQAIQFAGENLRADKSFMLQALECRRRCLV